MKRIIKLGDALSQLVNAVFFNGSCNESISGRAWRENRPWRPWIDALLWFDPDHCRVSYENDVNYAKELLAECTVDRSPSLVS